MCRVFIVVAVIKLAFLIANLTFKPKIIFNYYDKFLGVNNRALQN